MHFTKAPFTRAIFVRQFLCDEFYLLVYMRTFARILCGKYICRKTGVPVFMCPLRVFVRVYDSSHICRMYLFARLQSFVRL